MKPLALIFIAVITIEAFDVEFVKVNPEIPQKYSQESKIKFISISPTYKAPTVIKNDYNEDKVFSDIKLEKTNQYDPFAESKRVANEIENTKDRSKISNIHTDSNIKHIIYKSTEKSLSQKKFIQSLASFNQ